MIFQSTIAKLVKKFDMGIFNQARLKLTVWYFLVIAVISVSFSTVIYKELAFELDRVEQMQRIRIENRFPPPGFSDFSEEDRRSFYLDPNIVSETKARLKVALIIINAVILTVSTGGGYFLAGKTLRPISDMVDEQNRFISDASHELRTPITSIKTEIEVGLRDKKLKLPDAKKLLKSNLEEIDQLHKLTNSLLILNKAGVNRARMQKINLKDIALSAVEKIRPIVLAKKITIQKNLKNTPVSGDYDSLVELTTILLDNAVKYSKNGGKVVVRTKKGLGNIILEVQDFGVGIKASDLPHIFDRFFRAELSRSKDKTDGFGLGLSIAKNIAEAHQGSISVKSAPRKGSTFTATFPVRVA